MFKVGESYFHKKEVYLCCSLVLGVCLTVLLIGDYVALLGLEIPEHTSQSYTLSVLLINWIAFQLAILGFIYNCLAKQRTAKQIAAVSAGCNLVIFLIRISLELSFLELRKEIYPAE